MNRDEQIGRMILEASTGMHGDIARDLAQAWCNLAEKKQDMQSRLESLEKDAARYRWLRDEDTDVALVIDKRTNYTPSSDDGLTGGYFDYEYRCGAELDEAIDTDMQANKGE